MFASSFTQFICVSLLACDFFTCASLTDSKRQGGSCPGYRARLGIADEDSIEKQYSFELSEEKPVNYIHSTEEDGVIWPFQNIPECSQEALYYIAISRFPKKAIFFALLDFEREVCNNNPFLTLFASGMWLVLFRIVSC